MRLLSAILCLLLTGCAAGKNPFAYLSGYKRSYTLSYTDEAGRTIKVAATLTPPPAIPAKATK